MGAAIAIEFISASLRVNAVKPELCVSQVPKSQTGFAQKVQRSSA
jgi:hypothetical protein